MSLDKTSKKYMKLPKGLSGKNREDCELSWDNAILNVRMFGGSVEEALVEAQRRVDDLLAARAIKRKKKKEEKQL